MHTVVSIRLLLLAVVLCAIGAPPVLAAGQYEEPIVEWQKLFGGSRDEQALSVQQTTDGGYIFLGYSLSSASGTITDTNHGDRDVWIMKTDNRGEIQWQRLLGGNGWDYGSSIQQTPDGGYIVLASAASSRNGDVTGTNHGGYDSWGGRDVWVVKLTSSGEIQWQQLLGGYGNDYGESFVHTSDGGYIFVGYSFASANGDVTGTNQGASDLWVVKLDQSGSIQWQKLLGGTGFDHGFSLRQTADGGYILVGDSASSKSGTVTGTNHGGIDVWMLKLDPAGNIQWQKLIGGTGDDQAYSVDLATGGGYILFGSSKSNGTGDVISGNHGGSDIWVVKLDDSGAIQWQKLLGGRGNEIGYSGHRIAGGGYVLIGPSTSSSSGDVTDTNHGGMDYWIVQLNDQGQIQWQKLLGGSGDDNGRSVVPTTDSGYILYGNSKSSSSGDVTESNRGSWDSWVVKLKTGQTLTLNPGWNFVSVPAVLAPGFDTASIFASVDTDAHAIYLYNASTTTWTPMTSTTKVRALDGIWIYSKHSTTVPLSLNSNPQAVPPARDLAVGWNAIGYASTRPATAKDALSSVAGKWSTVLGFNAETQTYDIAIYTGGSGMYTDTRELHPFKGYWLWMREPGQLSGPGV